MLHSGFKPDTLVERCNCDRCASLLEGLPDTILMAGACEACGGRATLPPLCLSCTNHWFERQIALIHRSIAENKHLSWFGRDLLTLLQGRKAQLPTGSKRQGYWLGSGGRRDLQLRVTRNP